MAAEVTLRTKPTTLMMPNLNCNNGNSDIAVIGMSCRAAGVNSPSELWELLVSSRDVQSEITRFNTKGFYHPDGGSRKGLTNVKRAYMMDDNAIDRFDHAFFHITPAEAIAMDPQQRMLLEIAYEAVENAGIPLEGFVGTNTAVYAGEEKRFLWWVREFLSRDVEATPRYLATGTATCMAANRISYFFNLSGASMSIDTACSSTMIAFHQAVHAVQRGDSPMAIVCGAKLIITPDMFVASSELGFLSPTGRCRSFDADVDGYGRGEGVMALLLKPLGAAVADRDPIRAVVKGVALNQDGRTQGITLPSADAQQRNMEKLYADKSLDPADIQYLEAHGTGTIAGDPLEFSAINAVFAHLPRNEPLIVGSTKSNIGHLEACAALASIIKTIECLERGKITPQMHFRNPNPKIDFRNVQIPTHLVDWPSPRNGLRRAAINTFGAGGTNGHAVLEAYPPRSSQDGTPGRTWLFKVSAVDSNALRRLSMKYVDYVETRNPNIQDLAYTLLSRRSTLRQSFFFTARTLKDVVQMLRAESPKALIKSDGKTKNIAFLFTGQGAQWPQMGKALLEQSPLFKAVLLECERVLSSLTDSPTWSIIDELSKSKGDSNIYQSCFSQPLCTALQLGLVILWRSWGLVPSAVVGHSSGEIAAAYAAGYISLRDSMVIAYYRGLSLAGVAAASPAKKPNGAMCAVGLGEERAVALLERFEGRAQLAAVNSPGSCTFSGDRDAIEEIVGLCGETGIFCRQLRVDTAYHSHHVFPVAARYERALIDAKVSPLTFATKCQMFSSVIGQSLMAEACLPSYWKQNMVSTVRFAAALTSCIESCPEISAIVEIGPHPALQGPAMDVIRSLSKASVRYFHSCLRGRDDLEALLDSASAMIACGVPIETPSINAREVVNGLKCIHKPGNVLTDLPKIPPTVFVLMALEAARQLQVVAAQEAVSLLVSDVEFEGDLQLDSFASANSVELHLTACQSEEPNIFNFDITSFPIEGSSPPTRHCFGMLGWTESATRRPKLASLAVNHDPLLLENMQLLGRDTNHQLTELQVSSEGSLGGFEASHYCEDYCIDPLALDCILHMPPVSVLGQNLPVLTKISSIGSIMFPAQVEAARSGRFAIEVNSGHISGYESNIEMFFGKYFMSISDIRLAATGAVRQKPILKSLFFRQIMLPDITKISGPGQMSLSDCFEMLTHKWPMCDIGVTGLTTEDNKIILDYLKRPERSRFRSVQIVGEPAGSTDERIRFNEVLDVNTSFHIIFIGNHTTVDHLPGKLHSNGLVCVRSANQGGTPGPFNLFTKICEVTGFRDNDWALWRKNETSDQLLPGSKATVFTHSDQRISTIECLPNAEYISLQPESVQAFCQRGEKGVYDTIVIDCVEKSIIGTWPGDILVPWLQDLVALSKRIIWVTQRDPHNPFTGMAGTLLRTLQAEQPSLKTTWLIFDRGEDTSVIQKAIASTIAGPLVGDNEILYEVKDSKVFIRRYLPDDELSSFTGAALSRNVDRPIADEDYELILAAPHEPAILASKPIFFQSIETKKVLVKVEASVIDVDDINAFNGVKNAPSGPRCGRFFAGEVKSDSGKHFPRGSRVVGWQVGAHRNRLEVPHTQLRLCRGSISFAANAAHFAAICTGLCIVDGLARARAGDNFRINIGGILGEAISKFANDFGATVLGLQAQETVDFRVELTATDGLLVNHSSVDIDRYLASEHGAHSVNGAWAQCITFASPLTLFKLHEFKEAFQGGQQKAAYSSVLVHSNVGKVRGSIAVYRKPERLFSDGAYIIIGGLGGLGRYVCSWMVANGAKRLVTISRSGLESEEAQGTFRTINASGASIEVVKANACDRTLMSDVLSQIRRRHPIRGVINMAMVLSDAPLAYMKGENLDRALRAKVDSSWILHEETLHDELEFFIMFSSVASVIGNRNQTGYNVGNSFLNALAEYRRSQGLPGVAIALGAMSYGADFDSVDIGVIHSLSCGESLPNSLSRGESLLRSLSRGESLLYTLNREETLQAITRSGLSPLRKPHLSKIMEAAVIESHSTQSDRSLILTGLEMFERVDDKLVGAQDQTMLYWTELPEFGFLQPHRRSWSVNCRHSEQDISLRERIQELDEADARAALTDAFLVFLAGLLGFGAETFDPGSSLLIYGLDSLSGVSCQYWFYRELQADMTVLEILGAKSINQLIEQIYQKAMSTEVSRTMRNGAKAIRG
ncbi:Type I Iterative PKS [Glutinoglossum americanum]|uniref:Type I Iterative PKS n=1 Tax=Glutinoglossum americanum TaxID=1670608 RepID=A0A9P8IC60_9PEZI|nr:Type I Iterative PKS [Glutinoglossum americanum]